MIATTGFFDGVHAGHRHVIERLVSTAHARGDESLVVTFWPHPRAVLQDGARELRLLTTLEEKKALLSGLGVDRVEVLEFSRTFASLRAEEYLRDILQERFGVTALLMGYDNRLGSDKLGPAQIAPLAESLGLDVLIVPLAAAVSTASAAAGGAISSTKIREALAEGDVETAQAMLGYAYSLRGVVVGGKQLGRTIGFPTANLRLYDPLKLIPARGVYLTEVEVLGSHWWGMTNVGDILETHIFDFDEDIYGLDLDIEFCARLREERRFDSLEKLKEQLCCCEIAATDVGVGKIDGSISKPMNEFTKERNTFASILGKSSRNMPY